MASCHGIVPLAKCTLDWAKGELGCFPACEKTRCGVQREVFSRVRKHDAACGQIPGVPFLRPFLRPFGSKILC